MGIINVPGRVSGRQYPINIAGDVPDEVERGRIAQYIAEQEQTFAKEYTARFGVAPEAPEDDGTAIGRGWERGMASAKTRLGTTQRIIGEQTGLDFLKNYGVDVEEQGRYEQLLAQLSQPTPLEYTDVKGLGSGFTFVGEQIGQTAPETGAIMGAGILGTIGGTAATGNPIAGTALGVTAGALTAAPTIFGGNVQRQEEEVKAGRKDKVDLTDALSATVGQAAIEAITDKLILLKLVKPGQKIFSRTIRGLTEGAALEAPTEILQQVLERAQAGLPLDDDAAIQEYITGGISGAVVGGSIRAPLAMTGIGTGAQPTPSTTPTTPAVNPPALAGPTAPVTQLGVTAQEPQPEDFDNIADYNTALGQYYAGIAATTLTPEAKAAADAVAGVGAPKINATAQELGEPFTFTTIDGKKTLVAPTFESLKQALGLNPKQYYSVNELKAAALAKGFDAPSAYLSGAEVYKRLSAKRSSATPTVEDANVVKPTVTTGSKSGPPATKPGVGDGIGLDATQGTAKLETPAATGLGAAVSDTSTDNVPEGSQSAALMAQMAEWRADETAAKKARIAAAAAAAQAAAKLEGSKPATLGLFENMGENGALMEYPEVAASLNKYVQDIDFAALDVATKSGEYAQYKATMASNLAAAYPSGEIPVTRTEGYADPKAEKTKRNFTVRTEDVAFVGNVDEQELIIRTPEGKLQSVRIGTAPSIEEAKIAAEADPANKTAPGNEEFDFDFDEGFAEFDAARRAEKVAADLDAEVAAQAAAKLKDAQLPSMDEEVLDTVEGLGGARAAADARTRGYEQNIDRIVAESEQARAKQRAADEAQAAKIAAERTQQYGKGDLPLSRVPAEYAPMDWGFRYGQRSARRCSPQVIPATIRVSQAPPPVYKPEYISAKFWTDTFGLRSKSKMFQALAGEEISSSTVRDTLAKYAGTKGQSAAKTKIKAWLDKTAIKYTATPPDERSSEGLAAKAKFTAANRKKLDAANLAAQREKDALFNPEFAQLSVEDPYLNDVSTPSDKQKATAVAYRKFEGIKPEGTVTYRLVKTDKKTGKITETFKSSKMLPDTAAGKYFERYKRVVDALDAIASDYNGDIIAQAVDKEGPAIDNKFYAGLGKDSAFAARAWVDANMSEAVQKQLSSRIAKMSGSYLAAPDAVATKRNIEDEIDAELQRML
jgi:hypothetical protein